MDVFEYEVTIKVRVPAFNMSDADTVIEDAFGLGDQCGAEVYDSKVTPLGPVDN